MISNVLKKLREEKKLTRQYVADKLEITKRALETYEYGQSSPSLELVKKFADFYNVTTDFLLERETIKPMDMINEIIASGDIATPLEMYMELPETSQQAIIDFMIALKKARGKE